MSSLDSMRRVLGKIAPERLKVVTPVSIAPENIEAEAIKQTVEAVAETINPTTTPITPTVSNNAQSISSSIEDTLPNRIDNYKGDFQDITQYVVNNNLNTSPPKDLGGQQIDNISSLFITGDSRTTAATALQMNGIDTLRHPDANGMHFGNPFSPNPKSRASVYVPSIKDSVDYFKRWLQGDPSLANVEPERRAWIVNQINNGSLKGKPLIYYTDKVPNKDPKGYNTELYDTKLAPNHAHILLDFINNGISIQDPDMTDEIFNLKNKQTEVLLNKLSMLNKK